MVRVQGAKKDQARHVRLCTRGSDPFAATQQSGHYQQPGQGILSLCATTWNSRRAV